MDARAQADAVAQLADTHPGRVPPLAARALAAARRSGDPAAAAITQRAWGHALLQTGEMDDAIRHLRSAITHSRRAGLTTVAGEARGKLAYALVMRGRPRQALAEVDAAVRTLTGVAADRARAQRAVILTEIGRHDEALADYQAALPGIRASGDEIAVSRLLTNRSVLHIHRYAFAAAVADLGEAEAISARLGRPLAVGIIVENLGVAEALRGDVPAALAHIDRAERLIADNGGHVALAVYDRGVLLLAAGLAGEARQEAERAATMLRREGHRLKVPEARLLLAQAASASGDWRVAADQARLATREFASQHRSEWAALARLTLLQARLRAGTTTARGADDLVTTLAAAGWPAATVEAHLVAAALRPTVADAHLAAAARWARRRVPAAVRARGWYAEALRRAHADPARAVGAIRAGLRILDEHAASLGAADLRVHSAAHRRELTALGLRLALRDGRPHRVLEWAERGRASRLGHRPARPPADPLLADLLAQLRGVAFELADAGAADTARLVPRQVTLERRIRDHVRTHRPVGETPRWTPVPLDALRAALGERRLVEFVESDGVLHRLTLAGGRLDARAIGPVAPIADLVRRLPFALHRLARPGDARRSAAAALLDAAARALDAALLGGAGDEPLVVSPTGALHSVPWSILPSCAGRPVTVSPSATLWCAAAGPPATVDVAVVAGPRLVGARAEAQRVAAIHGVAPLLDAPVERVLAVLGTVGVLHLAAHGRLSTDNPLFSDLLLADGPLLVHDLERLDRTPHTVSLAACDSGRAAVYAGDELLGLSATLATRGTAQLVAPVLPVPDLATEPVMVAYHERLAAGAPPAVALAATQHALRDADPPTRAAAAGFNCFGHGFTAPFPGGP
ncbi:CHAT domain-containing protein [Asanoa iriomotensis]|uniref:CHAT domain-containing protein n=1 Tax=Asanoa iriomotensis TaxID=234613 RepID=A0ABQ4BTZ3_9ACTN|nr:CHAT domain-containing protein [Asanoa iriomotensis]GIF53999.1 CHAT domain-containing protein [Asanoa iriomotensis]